MIWIQVDKIHSETGFVHSLHLSADYFICTGTAIDRVSVRLSLCSDDKCSR